jgi:transcriptional regulator with XRE-family HTH domain
MTGTDLKTARLKTSWTQQQAASRLGLTQAYLSMLEHGKRSLTSHLAAQVQNVFDLPPTTLPLEPEDHSLSLKEDELKCDLGALGYPGFSYLREKPTHNPAQVLFYALDQSDLDTRVVEALPWLTYTYMDMDWEWLIRNAKERDRQNRLGFVVTVASELAEKTHDPARSEKLNGYQTLLDRSRLVHEDTLCHDSMTKSERKWLQQNRPAEARHWNLLTDLELKNLAYVPA